MVLLLIAAGVGAQGQPDGSPQPIGPTPLTGTPISSTFTYQGQLNLSGSAVSGPCDFQFSLWDAANVGAQLGLTQTLSAVNVANGLFTVPLNFGATAFTGEARWLGIAVRCPAGSGLYAPLDPRQAVTPAPLAFYAGSTGGLQGYPITTTAPTTGQVLKWNGSAWIPDVDNTGSGGGTYSNGFGLNLIGNVFSVLTSTIQSRVSSTCPAGTAIRTVNADGTVTCEPIPPVFNGWSLTGNNGTGVSNFLGTTDNMALTLSVNNVAALRLIPNATAPILIGGYAGNTVNGVGGGSIIAGGGGVSGANLISGTNVAWSTISGGTNNQISEAADGSVIGGGGGNQISGSAGNSAIGGGVLNVISGSAYFSAIGGGASNQISGSAYDSAIGSGISNQISGDARESAIGSGHSNLIGGSAYNSAIGGGYFNQINGAANDSAIGGGYFNLITGTNTNQSTIGGGAGNTISGIQTIQSTIGGGAGNTISGTMATIPGGYDNTAAGDHSFAAGTQAKANHTGAFVWGDSTLADFASTADNQFLIRANGGVGIGTNAPVAQLHVSSNGGDAIPQLQINQTNASDYARLRLTVNGDYGNRWDVGAISTTFSIYSGHFGQEVLKLTPGGVVDYMMMGNSAHLTAGGAWTNASDRNVKANFAPVDSRAVLDKVLGLPISTWNYKAEDAATRHLGPMAQDFAAAFALGSDDKSISTVDEEGVALAAVQGLYQVMQEKDARITQLENEVAQLKSGASTTGQPVDNFNVISTLLSAIALGGVIAIGWRQKSGGVR